MGASYQKVINTETGEEGWQCQHCDMVFSSRGEILRHLNPKNTSDTPTCEKLDFEKIKQDKEIAKAKDEQIKGITNIQKETVYKTDERVAANDILRSILSRHPSVNAAQTEEIMDWAGLRGKLTPFEVNHLLNQLKGSDRNTSNLISQKYAAFLEREANEGNTEIQLFLSGTPQMGNNVFGSQPNSTFPSFSQMNTQNTQQQPNPFSQFPQPSPMTYNPPKMPDLAPKPTISLSDVENVIDRREIRNQESSKFDSLQNELRGLKDIIMHNVHQSQNQQNIEREMIEEPIDNFGNIVPPEQATSVRRRSVPIGSNTQQQQQNLTINDVEKLFAEREQKRIEESKYDKINQEISRLKELIVESQQVKEQPKIETQTEIIEEPIDAEGNLTTPENAVTIRRRTVPIGSQNKDGGMLQIMQTLKNFGIIKQDDKPLSRNDIAEIINSLNNDKKLSAEDVNNIIESRMKDQQMEQLTSLISSQNNAISNLQQQIHEGTGNLSNEQQIIREQRMLLSSAGDKAEGIIAKTLETIQPLILRKLDTVPANNKYSDNDIERFANDLDDDYEDDEYIDDEEYDDKGTVSK